MKAIALFFLLLTVSVLCGNPIQPVFISELAWEDSSWVLEIYDYYLTLEMIDLDGSFMTTSAGTAYFNNGITSNANNVFVVDSSDLQQALAINPAGDEITISLNSGFYDQISFGTVVNPPYSGQSLARIAISAGPPMYDESFYLVKNSQPSLGSEPFTVSSYGTFAGYVFDSVQNPVENVQLEFVSFPDYMIEPITTDAAGYFSAELPGRNYIFNIHLEYLASLPDTTLTIEPDSLNYFEFVFTDYICSAVDEVELEAANCQLANYPNPFYLSSSSRSPVTEFRFRLPDAIQAERAEIVIFNLKGQKVKTLQIASLSSNQAGLSWNGTNNQDQRCPAGVYFSKLLLDNKIVATDKMLLLK